MSFSNEQASVTCKRVSSTATVLNSGPARPIPSESFGSTPVAGQGAPNSFTKFDPVLSPREVDAGASRLPPDIEKRIILDDGSEDISALRAETHDRAPYEKVLIVYTENIFVNS